MERQKSSDDCNKELTSKSQSSSNGSAPTSPLVAESSGPGVFRAARELAQLRADLAEIGVDPGCEDGGSNPSTPSGRKGPGRGRGRQAMQYEEVPSWHDEENGITYKKGGQYAHRQKSKSRNAVV